MRNRETSLPYVGCADEFRVWNPFPKGAAKFSILRNTYTLFFLSLFNTKFGEKEFFAQRSTKKSLVFLSKVRRICKLNFSRIMFSETIKLSLSLEVTNLLIELRELRESKERLDTMDNISKDCRILFSYFSMFQKFENSR